MKISVAKGLSLAVGFGITTGLIIPWLISNDSLPLPLILILLGCVVLTWVILMEKPFRLFYKFVIKKFKELNK